MKQLADTVTTLGLFLALVGPIAWAADRRITAAQWPWPAGHRRPARAHRLAYSGGRHRVEPEPELPADDAETVRLLSQWAAEAKRQTRRYVSLGWPLGGPSSWQVQRQQRALASYAQPFRRHASNLVRVFTDGDSADG